MAVEANIYALWVAKQTAKGTPATVATKRQVQVAGDLRTIRADGSENFSDLDRFGNMTDFADTLIGQGDPGIEAHPDQLAYLLWLFFGQEAVTGGADPYTHTFTPGTNGGFWSTWWKRVGQNVIDREKFNDCMISQLVIEGSTAQKVVRVTPTLMSLDAGEIFTTDPAAAMPTDNPFLYTEGAGTFTVNGVVLSGQSQFTITMNENRNPYYGDDVKPVDLVVGNAEITLAATILADSAGVAEYNKRIYGTATPAAGVKPLKVPEANGTYTFTLTKANAAGPITPARTFQVTVPGMKWSPDVAVPPNPGGGPVEIALAGSMRKVAVTPAITCVVKNGSAAYTV